jgi:hypothetical protein
MGSFECAGGYNREYVRDLCGLLCLVLNHLRGWGLLKEGWHVMFGFSFELICTKGMQCAWIMGAFWVSILLICFLPFPF